MMRAESASCAPGTTRNRLSATALSMIWRKLAGIERLSDCGYGRGADPACNSIAVCPKKLAKPQCQDTLRRHSGRAKREPESITPVSQLECCGLWIPGSRLWRAPE